MLHQPYKGATQRQPHRYPTVGATKKQLRIKNGLSTDVLSLPYPNRPKCFSRRKGTQANVKEELKLKKLNTGQLRSVLFVKEMISPRQNSGFVEIIPLRAAPKKLTTVECDRQEAENDAFEKIGIIF